MGVISDMETFIGAGAFWAAAILVVLSGLGVVLCRRPLHSALWLICALLGTAMIYAWLEAHFLAVAQILVYAGGVMVLVVMVLMLLGGEAERFRFGAAFLGMAALVCGGAWLWVLIPLLGKETGSPQAVGELGGAVNIGRALYGRFLFPFEATALLILAALVGALLLAGRRK